MRAERERIDKKIIIGYTKGVGGGERLESGQEGRVLERMVGKGIGGWQRLAKEKGLTWGEKEGRKGEILIWTAVSEWIIRVHWTWKLKRETQSVKIGT